MSAKAECILEQIRDALIKPAKSKQFITNNGSWTAFEYGKSKVYVQQITYAGATMLIDLSFGAAVQINRVEQVWNDGTAKDAEIRAYSDVNNAYYAKIDSVTTNTDTSRITQLGIEYKYPAFSKLQLSYANFTIGKIVKIIVQVDEL